MARYIGPKSKIARRFGEPIFGADKVLSRRNFPPGQHGNNRRRKQSEYAVMLAEKQKAKYTYGVLERQFRNMFEKAAKAEGITGEVLLQNLESRLDNVVFRLGIAPTRAAARQLVGHKHIVVDGNVVNIPSYSAELEQLGVGPQLHVVHHGPVRACEVRHPQAAVARLEKAVVAREGWVGNRDLAGRGASQPKAVGRHGKAPALQGTFCHEYFKLCAHVDTC